MGSKVGCPRCIVNSALSTNLTIITFKNIKQILKSVLSTITSIDTAKSIPVRTPGQMAESPDCPHLTGTSGHPVRETKKSSIPTFVF